MKKDPSGLDDMIDVNDLITRFEELEGEKEKGPLSEVEDYEFTEIKNALEEMKGYGGDEQWRGDWYPGWLIRDSHFRNYTMELAEETVENYEHTTQQWPFTCIDWDMAMRELQMDYSVVSFDGTTYWYRT